MVEAPQVTSLSQITKDARSVNKMLGNGPVMLMQKSSRFGMLVDVDEWNKIAKTVQKLRDLEDIVAMQQLEIDRLKADRPETVPADIGLLEEMAGRVAAKA